MTEQEAKESLQDMCDVARCRLKNDGGVRTIIYVPIDKVGAFDTAVKALDEIQQYRAMEQRLKDIYGECDGLLETVIAGLEKHEGTELPEPIAKARLLTDGMADMWEEYKAIGTVGEIRRMQKYSALAKKQGTIGKVIEDCAEYESIGTMEECREAREKQVPVKITSVLSASGHKACECGNCGNELSVSSFDGEYCHWCGQKLDWSAR